LGTEIKCKKCSHSLAKFDEVPFGIVWYSQLRHSLGGICPECGHKLPSVSDYAKKMRLEVKATMSVLVK